MIITLTSHVDLDHALPVSDCPSKDDQDTSDELLYIIIDSKLGIKGGGKYTLNRIESYLTYP